MRADAPVTAGARQGAALPDRSSNRDGLTAAFVLLMAIGQIVSWGTTYFSFPVVAVPMASDLGLGRVDVYAAASFGLAVGAFASIPVGRWINQGAARTVMTVGAFASGIMLMVCSQVTRGWMLYPIFVALGITQSMIYYDAAFAVLSRRAAGRMREAVASMTFWAGFSSTIFVPLTHVLVSQGGWRFTLLVLGALQASLGASLHFMLLQREAGVRPFGRALPRIGRAEISKLRRQVVREPTFWMIVASMSIYLGVLGAFTLHLYPMLMERGASSAATLLAIGVIGPAQACARVGMWRWTTQMTTRTMALAAPLTLLASLAAVAH